MKKIILSLTVLILILVSLASCGENTKITMPVIQDTVGIAMGTPDTFDLVTWNLKSFPIHNPETTSLLKVLIPNLKADCIAIQEMPDHSSSDIQQLVSQMPNWSYILSSSGDGYTRSGILYNNVSVSLDSSATIFSEHAMSNPFPRAPIIAKFGWHGQDIYVISVHLKAMGDNVINESNYNDEEVRRRYACQLLDQYIEENLSDKKVIIAGDMNDQIQEPATTNVFMSFINKSAEYLFTDMTIAQNLTTQNCSYPNLSHLDHIIITNELFNAFTAGNNYVKTIQIENYISGGLSIYKKYISDHRPVGARFYF